MSNSKSGKNHPNWKGGMTPLCKAIRNLSQNKTWIQKVFKRDNYTCQECGDSTGGNLEAHHIVSFTSIISDYNIKSTEDAIKCDFLWDIDNGITYCVDCH